MRHSPTGPTGPTADRSDRPDKVLTRPDSRVGGETFLYVRRVRKGPTGSDRGPTEVRQRSGRFDRVAAMANEAGPGVKKPPVGRDQALCIIQNEWLSRNV